MFALVVLLCCVGAFVSSEPQKPFYNLEDAPSYFEDFVKTYNKEYKNEAEKQARFEIFKNNLEGINMDNKMYPITVFGINQFTDLTREEFTRKYGLRNLGNIRRETGCSSTRRTYNGTRVAAPDSFDWRQQNKVTSVKDQSNCGSCWAFSTVGTAEGQYAIKYNQLIDLSTQQFVDCGKRAHGCGGGLMSNAILDIMEFGGIMSEQDYPYHGFPPGTCQADASKIAVRVTNCREFFFSSEEEIKEPLVQVGPMTVFLSSSGFQTYTGGILSASKCDQKIDHGVLLVGYGTENGTPYWIIKNSWGSQFGESGFIRISRNENTCNLMAGQFVIADVQ